MTERVTTLKKPLPGWGLLVVDGDKDDVDDNFGKGAQVGTLLNLHDEDKGTPVREGSNVTFGDLIGRTIYCRAYIEADGRWFDEELGKDVIFIDLTKIMGME